MFSNVVIMTLNYVLCPISVQNPEKMHVLKVYIYFPCINTQRQATALFDDTPVISTPHRKYLKIRIYQGFVNRCEVDLDSVFNRLDSATLDNTLL